MQLSKCIFHLVSFPLVLFPKVANEKQRRLKIAVRIIPTTRNKNLSLLDVRIGLEKDGCCCFIGLIRVFPCLFEYRISKSWSIKSYFKKLQKLRNTPAYKCINHKQSYTNDCYFCSKFYFSDVLGWKSRLQINKSYYGWGWAQYNLGHAKPTVLIKIIVYFLTLWNIYNENYKTDSSGPWFWLVEPSS